MSVAESPTTASGGEVVPESPLDLDTRSHQHSAAGTWFRIYRHHLQLLRNQAIAWVAVIAGVGVLVALGYQDVYETQAQREAAAASIEGVPAFEALFGRTVEIATLEGFLLWRWGGFAILLAGIWGMRSGARLLRGAEESGHVEPLRAGAVSPRGLVAATLAALFTVQFLLAATVGLSHTAVGMDAASAWAMGGALALLAAVFALVAALAAQFVSSQRHVMTMTGVVLGAALGLRVLAAGSGTPDWFWGATPFGWASYLHEVDGARAAVFSAYLVSAVVLTALTLVFARRDLHGGQLGQVERSYHDAPSVGNDLSLAARLVRGPLVVWGAILGLSGLVFGLMAEDFAAAMADLPDTMAMAEQIGWFAIDTPEGIVASMMLFLALVLCLFAAAQAAAIREEEASWRIEHLLVRPVGRVRWLLGRVAVSMAAIVVLAFVTVAAAWVGVAIVGSPMPLGDLPATALNLVPIAWLFLGIGVALAGIVPRLTAPVTYGAVIAAYVLDLVGGIIELHERVLELGPFRHLAAVPVQDYPFGAALIMVVVAAVAVAIGISVFRRRDLQEA